MKVYLKSFRVIINQEIMLIHFFFNFRITIKQYHFLFAHEI